MQEVHHRLLILGSGPAGLTAAIYAARANLNPVVITGIETGGQLTTTTEVDNWPSGEQGLQGPDLMVKMQKHAERFDTQIIYDHINKAEVTQNPFRLYGDQAVYTCDALIITTGIALRTAQVAAGALSASGIEATILHMPTLKPLDVEALLDFAAPVQAVVTVEEHTVVGGLGSAVAEVIAEADFFTPKRFKRLGIPDVFPDEYGSQNSLMERYDITSESIVSTVTQLLEAPIGAMA